MNINTTNGTNNGTNNCIDWPYTIPYSVPTVYSYTVPTVYWPTKIRTVSNGFIVELNSKEHVFQKIEEMLKFLKEEISK